MDSENTNLPQTPTNTEIPVSIPVPPKKNKVLPFLLGSLVITALLLVGAIVFIQQQRNQNTTQMPINLNTTSESNKIKTETAIHTFFEKDQITATVNEISRHYGEQMLETVVTKDGQKLSQQLFLPNMILQLNKGSLSQQRFTTKSNNKTAYRTSSENILEYIKTNSDLKPTTSTTNGVEIERYTIGKEKASTFLFIKSALAQDNSELVYVYIEKTTGEIKKIERLDPLTNQKLEVIDYQVGFLPPPPFAPITPTEQVTETETTTTPSLSPLPTVSQLDVLKEKLLAELQQEELIKQSSALLPIIATANEMNQEATSVKINNLQPPIIPDEAIYLEPSSVIPTASSYNSPTMMLTSRVFNQQATVDKDIKEKGGFDTLAFAKNNIKIRIDGVEIQNTNLSLSTLSNESPTSSTAPWRILSTIPKGLTPGYHTVEVYMVNSWYLAPSLLVVLPRPDEKITELQLSFDKPPKAVMMPDNQNYKITLYGKNFSKPLSVYLDDTLLNDNSVVVSSPEELTLIVPVSTPKPSHGPAYDVTIVKDGQKIIRPSFLSVGGPQ